MKERNRKKVKLKWNNQTDGHRKNEHVLDSFYRPAVIYFKHAFFCYKNTHNHTRAHMHIYISREQANLYAATINHF